MRDARLDLAQGARQRLRRALRPHMAAMTRARLYRLKAGDYAQQARLAAAHQRPMFRLLAEAWRGMAAREDERARLGETRSFAPARWASGR